MKNRYYSVRMHAGRQKLHLSGAERLVREERVEAAVIDMLRRGGRHRPDSMQVSVDAVDESEIVRGSLPVLNEKPVRDVREGREEAVRLLCEAGVYSGPAAAALAAIASGPGPGHSIMRGAMLIDGRTGQRLEPQPDRGVRVSRLDISPKVSGAFEEILARRGLEHFRTREALILAAKVMQAPGVIAELCWSDDPDYTAGYVCSPSTGYVRIGHLKETGDPYGGRTFFLKPDCDPAATIRFLEEVPFLVDCIEEFDLSSATWEDN